jgi:O-antigen/teichoic acid export membrane protein
VRQLLRRHAPTGPALWLVIGRAVGFAVMFVVPLVLVRLFDQSTFGTYKQLFLVYATLYGLAQLGVAESLYFFLPQRPSDAGRYAANAVVTLAFAGLGCAAALMLAGPAIGRWLTNPELAAALPLLGVFLGLMLTSALFEIVLVARGRYRAAAWAYASSDVARAVFLLLPALLLGGLRGLLLGAVAFAAVRLAVMLWTFGRGLSLTLHPGLAMWREQWIYTLPFALAVGLDVLQANLHQYVVAARFDPALFAIYAVGCLQIPLVDVLTTSSANVMMVAMADGDAGRRPAYALALWHDTTRRLAIVIVPLVVFLVAMAPEVIGWLFTRQYLESVPVFRLWTCTLLLAVPCVDAVLRARADTRFLLGLNVLRLALVIALIGWCLDRFGLAGAALAMLVATAVTRALAIGRIARLLGAGLRTVLPWRSLATAAACALVAVLPALWCARALPMPPPAALAVAAAAFAVVYGVLCLRLVVDSTTAPALPALQGAVR